LGNFIFTHFPLLNQRLRQLELFVTEKVLEKLFMNDSLTDAASVSSQGQGGQGFILPLCLQQDLQTAVHHFKERIRRLFHAPRLSVPLWLQLNTFPSQSASIKEQLVKDVLDCIDWFEKDQFLSKYLSGILQYHTGWARTVAFIVGQGEAGKTFAPSQKVVYLGI
jgi:hypothetical protein